MKNLIKISMTIMLAVLLLFNTVIPEPAAELIASRSENSLGGVVTPTPEPDNSEPDAIHFE